MLGFELELNGEVISVSVGNKCLTIIFSYCRNEFELRFSGTDLETSDFRKWYVNKLKEGNRVSVKIKNITKDSLSLPLEYKDLTMQEDLYIEKQNEVDLQNYLQLKRVLTKKNLLC